jgi:hypothetical protein
LGAAGCTSRPGDELEGRDPELAKKKAKARDATPERRWLLEWGQGPGEVGLRSGGEERAAFGPAAIALAADGRVYVLDQMNGRVLALDPQGRDGAAGITTFAEVPVDCEHLAVGPDGAVGVASMLRSRIWLYGPEGGMPVGTIEVPRTIRHVRGLALTGSRRVWLHTAFQESFLLGSPAAPLSLTSVLAGKREGAAFLGDGTGLQVRLGSDGRVELLAVDPPSGSAGAEELRAAERTRRVMVLSARQAGSAGSAARIVGVDEASGVVCVRLEEVSQPAGGGAVSVDRMLTCVEAATERKLLELGLPQPGLYTPRQEIAVGASAGRVAWMHPTSRGLEIVSVALSGLSTGERER